MPSTRLPPLVLSLLHLGSMTPMCRRREEQRAFLITWGQRVWSGRWEQGWIHGRMTCFHPKGPAVGLMLCSCHLEMLNHLSLNLWLVSEVWWDSRTCTWIYEMHMCVCNCLWLPYCHTVCRVLTRWLPWYTYFVLGAMCSEGLHTWFNSLWPSCNS